MVRGMAEMVASYELDLLILHDFEIICGEVSSKSNWRWNVLLV